MNRRRIGLAVLAGGAGAYLRSRQRTSAPSTGADGVVESSMPEVDLGADGVVESSMSEVDSGADGVVESSMPEADLAATDSGSDVQVGADAEETGEAQVPSIVLPGMPAAGTDEIREPLTSATLIDEPAVSSSDLLDSASVGIDTTNPVVIDGAANSPEPASLVAALDQFPTPPERDGLEPLDASSTSAAIPAPPFASASAAPGGTGGTVPPPPVFEPRVDTVEPPKRGSQGWKIFGGVMAMLLVAAAVAGSLIRLPYYSFQPGSVYDTIERVEAPGDLVFLPEGEIGFVTVAQTADISPWQWLDAKLDRSVRIRHRDEVRGDQTAEELREADLRRMQVSKDAAVVLALSKLGFELIVTPIGVEVAQVFDCTAADGSLGTGDLIVGLNGVDIRSGEDLIAELAKVELGQTIEMLVERIDPNNPTQSMRTDLVGITPGSADDACLPDDIRADEERPFIGIGTLPMFEESLPVDIELRTGRVGGPSAGLAFTLAVIDVLSEGELTNGLSIVATGTIDRDGNVGPVGGIQQKVIAAERAGADVFLVPMCCDNFVSRSTGEALDIPSNYEEALEFADDIQVIGVNTLDEALAAIGALGGDVKQFLE